MFIFLEGDGVEICDRSYKLNRRDCDLRGGVNNSDILCDIIYGGPLLIEY